jgi:hypothetical protein
MAGKTGRDEVRLLLRLLDQAFGSRGWHGPTLSGLLRGVTPRQALWRPAPGRNSIWALVLHTAYWKYAVRRRLAGDAIGSFPRSPSNFPDVPRTGDHRAWSRDVRLLRDEHRKLVRLVAALAPGRLRHMSPKGRWTNAEMIAGVAQHDLYHAGQIAMLKRLAPR